MKNVLNIFAALLIIIWAFVFFGHTAPKVIHALPLMSCVIIIINLFIREKPKNNN